MQEIPTDVCLPASGLVGGQTLEDPKSTIAFTWENDVASGSDKNYTNGIRLAVLSGTNPDDWFSRALRNTFLGNDNGTVVRSGLALRRICVCRSTPRCTGSILAHVRHCRTERRWRVGSERSSLLDRRQ